MKRNKKYGGIMKNYSFGGDLFKYGLNNLEQATLGTFGLDFYKPKFDSDTFQQVNDITQKINNSVQNVAAGVANTVVPGISGARQVGKQISQFEKGGSIHINPENKGKFNATKERTGKTTEELTHSPNPITRKRAIFAQNAAKWKHALGGGILPENPNDLDDITENTVEYDGKTHKSGGIPLNNGKELEKDETVIKQGALGNNDPYAISPNLVLDKQTAKLVGLPSKYVGMKLSDISRKIEDMKPAKKNDTMSEKTNSMNKKFALNSLIKANELLSAQHRQEQGVNEKSDLRQEEMQLGGGGNLSGSSMLLNSIDGTRLAYQYPDLDMSKLSYSPYTDVSLYKNRSKLGVLRTMYNLLRLARENKNRSKLGVLPDNVGTSVLNNSTNLNMQNLDVPKFDLPNGKDSFDLKSNLGNIGMGLKGASLLANFATIGKKPGQIPAQFNPYATDILNNYRNSIDNQAIKNDVTSVLNTGLNANPSRNWNVQRAINSDLVGRSMEAMSKANLQNQELNNRYRTELGNVQNNLGQQDVQAKNMAEVLNAQTQANWRNNLRSAIGNVGNDFADMLIQKQFVQDATKDGLALTKEKIKLLQQKWGSLFGQDANKFKEMLKAAYPSITDEELTKMINE